MGNIIVSIIIATFKRKETLIRSIESVVNQTYEYIELIVVDDNVLPEWNDLVEKIVFSFSKSFIKNRRIKYIKNNLSHGPGGARNCGILSATGQYISFLDDDDLFLPNKVKKQVEQMEISKGDFSVTNSLMFNDSNKLVTKTNRIKTEHLDSTALLRYHIMNNITNPNTMMFRTDFIKKIGGFENIDIGEEYFLIEKAIINNGKYVYVDRYDVKCYIHLSNKSSLSVGAKKIEGEQKLFKHKKSFFKILKRKEQKYVIVRHHVVLLYTYWRMHNIFLSFWHLLICFLVSPINTIKVVRYSKGVQQ